MAEHFPNLTKIRNPWIQETQNAFTGHTHTNTHTYQQTKKRQTNMQNLQETSESKCFK